MGKGLRGTVGRQLLLVATAGAALYYFSSGVLSTLLGLGGQYLAGVPTTVGATELRLTEGRVRLTDLRLANPGGFESPHLLSVRRLDAVFDPASLRNETIVITELVLEGIALHVERSDLRSNAGIVLTRLAGTDAGAQPPGRRLLVRRLELREASALVAYAPALGAAHGQVAVALEDVVLEDVGADPAVHPATLAHRLLEHLVSVALLEAARRKNAIAPANERELRQRVDQVRR